MLDDITKKRINTLRQILVGKLPDPKAQVEQITNGLIYKFMNDMDEQSVSMGGKSTYFSGKFEKYSWKNLMDTKTSGVEKVKLYEDAVEQMYTNENLPELFREIFKNSFLPFKDPSTLNMFLKEINKFNYSNSEKLGDAFEYLLSFMGSQGDAGQFRTPRHIIDFIVEIVNPQKNETILDPACGTAGFLISTYKHILNQNTKKNLGDGLTASERIKIGENLNGYDISPDMVKMSLVNMYLHKFTNPKINEYDTLSSEDRWNEYYDVILANPPFFSPKGGITPHNRFGVKSSKAEVLFVDYINEHLKPNGRAGIIVPEGIIFQNGNAYKQLRKKLLETSLIGIVSLPVGVFQPYSGVKTSILILDKEIKKDLDNIVFISIENDGYSLGAQRRKIQGSQLDEISKNFKKYLFGEELKKHSNVVSKDQILKNESFSLSISNYTEVSTPTNVDLKPFKIKDIIDVDWGNTNLTKSSYKDDGKYLGVSAAGVDGKIDKYEYEGNKIVISAIGAKCGKVFFPKDKFTAIKNTIVLHKPKKDISEKFLFYVLDNNIDFFPKRGGGQPFISKGDIEKTTINLPNFETQNKIVHELDGYQKIIDGCKQIVKNYKPSFDIKKDWTNKKIKEISKLSYGLGYAAKEKGKYRIIRITDINENGLLIESDKKYVDITNDEKKYILKQGEVLVARTGATYGKCLFFEGTEPSVYAGYLIKLEFDKELILPKFFWIFSQSENFNSQKKKLVVGGGQPQFNANTLGEVVIPIPSLKEQEEIISYVLEEQKIINQNMNLLKKFEKKISERVNTIWTK